MSISGTSSRKLQLSLIGFGRVVQNYYLPALQKLPNVHVMSVVDPLPEVHRIVKNLIPSAQLFTDHRSMLERCAPDAVLIATPPSAHLRIWKDTTSIGIPTFVEKPLLLSSQIPDIDPLRKEPGIMVDFNRRFWPTYCRIQDLVQEGMLGFPLQLEFTFHLNLPQWSGVTNHRTDPKEGGLLHDLGCHAIDLAMQVFNNEPVAIEMLSSKNPETLPLRLQFQDDSTASFDLAYGNRTREQLLIRGPEGTIRLYEPNMAVHVHKKGFQTNFVADFLCDGILLAYRGFRRSQSMGQASIGSALRSFIDCLRAGKSFVPGYKDGVRNALWIAAAERSAAFSGKQERPSS